MRYADDILLFAKSLKELQNMMTALIEELGEIGLNLNAAKTKIITNEVQDDNFVMIGDVKVDVIEENGTHKYLGRYLPGVFENRGNIEITHRIQCAWYKFHRHSSTLCNKNVSIKLRLKLFDATVSPSLLFGLSVLPISHANMTKLLVCQRKMLRKIVGWVWCPGKSWESIMHIMKIKVENAMQQYLVKPWDERIRKMRAKYLNRLASMPNARWEKLSLDWSPIEVVDYSQDHVAYRLQGRPLLRWTDA